MSAENYRSKELVSFLSEFREAIAYSWAQELAALLSSEDTLRFGNLQDITGDCLDALLNGIACPEGDCLDLSGCPSLAWLADHDPGVMVEAFWLCREAVQPYILVADRDIQPILNDQLDACLRAVTTRLAHLVSEKFREQATRANERTALITNLVLTVGSTLNLTEVLNQAGEAIALAGGADHCFFYLVGADLELIAAVPLSMAWPQELLATSQGMARIKPDFLDKDDAVWKVLKEKRPVQIFDAQNDPRTTHVEELRTSGIKSFLLVPCLAKSQVVAIGVVSVFDACREFSSETIELAWAIATVIAPAIENARLYQKVEQLAAIEERARLAHEMHDRLAQTLGAMQLKASQAGHLLETDNVELARSNLDELSQIAKEAYTDVREAIFHLRSKPPAGEAFFAYLRDYLATYQTCFRIRVELEISGEPAVEVNEIAGDQVLRIIQEALTNIRKHASAGLVKIRFAAAGEQIQVDIVDDGAGFDPAAVGEGSAWRHFGLQIMRERAAALGGSVSVSSQPGQGTRVRLSIPRAPSAPTH